VEALALADRLAHGGRVQELTPGGKALGLNRVYRIWPAESASQILKVYGTPARERRERHALEALGDISGLPVILDRGSEGETVWALFVDAGQWTFGALPENPRMASKAGEILAAVHNSTTEAMSNLSRGIDQEWVTVDFLSTFRRLERYRGRIGVTAEQLDAARRVRPPYASEPKAAHTDPKPDNFLVNEEGDVTLINWEWATLAPPEWDLSKAVWLASIRSGPNAASALQDGYGRHMDPAQLDRWIVYHAAMNLVHGAEQQISGGSPESFDDLVAELQRAVTGSGSEAI
jgi:aminoglycoside phosphotransferase (APT) family kinase protein